ncbi:MAG TPA: copper transporter [Actinomycetota bacterium]|nr:copper transporter [Actinomycetota bacterium]
MVDFRYHIVSIVAVFLALGIGLLMGSGVLGDPLLDNIRERARDVQDFNNRLKSDVGDLEDELTVARRFTEAVEPMLVEDRLTGQDVVLVDFAASELPLDTLVETLEDRAGATVAAIVSVTDDIALAAEEDVEELRTLTGSPAAEPDELRVEAARQLGERLGALAAGRRSQRGEVFLGSLEEAGFVDVAEEDEDAAIPAGARFVLVASGAGEPPYPVEDVVAGVAEGLAAFPVAAVGVEAAGGTWGAARAVRDDGDLSNALGTVDNVDKLSGRIALVMALGRVGGEEPGHFGEKTEASGGVIPEPGLRD